jgi:WD40 repeat protein/tRNA A-37 threonylcarbamoyl transferase component Bud32
MTRTDTPFRRLDGGDWVQCERAVERFEDAWRRGPAPALDDYLPAGPGLRHAVLVELVHTDLELRLAAGEDTRVERYLDRYPELAADRGATLELVTAEYALRLRRDSGQTVGEYVRRFPGLADDLPAWLDRAAAEAEPTVTRTGRATVRSGDPAEWPAIPGYEILGELGRGGMGVVYKARQVKLNRTVAVKMILAGPFTGPEDLTRFRTEAEAAARLQHPNIVQVHEVGEQDGRPYVVLEYVDGGGLAARLGGTPLPAREAAELVETLARAMHYAHSRGVVHRDLKPANVLLTADGAPKVSDFGLAKRLDQSDGPTLSGSVVGTPSYMAPEQAAGKSKEIGPAADVYALGAILYELLTGRPPFHAATPLDTLYQVVHQDPVPVRRLNPANHRDLETVCLMCLEKDSARRYPSALALTEDLRRFLTHRPILARPAAAWERGWRWCRRNPAVAALLVVAVGLLAATAAVGLVGYVQTSAALQESEKNLGAARVARAETSAALEQSERNLGAARVARAEEAEQRRAAEMERDSAKRRLYLAHLHLASRAWESGETGRVKDLLTGHRAAGQDDLRGWEWYYLLALCHRDLLTLSEHTGTVWNVTWSPDGTKLASASSDGTVRVRDVAGPNEFRVLTGHTGPVRAVAWSPDGRWLASAGEDRTVRVWDADAGREDRTLDGHTRTVMAVAWGPDGRHLASAGEDQTLRVWDVAERKEVFPARKHEGAVLAVAWSPDGRRIASAGNDQAIRGWDASTGAATFTLTGHDGTVRGLSWRAETPQLASAGVDRTVRLWDLDKQEGVRTLYGHADWVIAVAWDPGGGRLASGGKDRIVRVWDPATGNERLTHRGHAEGIGGVAWHPDGGRLASCGDDRTVKIWDPAAEQTGPTLRGNRDRVNAVAWSPDGRWLASAGRDRRARVWDAGTGAPAFPAAQHAGPVHTVAWSRGGWLASAGDDKAVWVWNPVTRKVRTLGEHNGAVRGLAWSPDGRRLASAGDDRTVRVWDVEAGTELWARATPDGAVRAVAWTPDGRRLASAHDDPRQIGPHRAAPGEPVIRVWDVATGDEAVQPLRGHTGGIDAVSWAPDGRRLASASWDRTVRVWDVAGGEKTYALTGHARYVLAVAWSPDGRRIASAGDDLTVKLWDPVTCQETLTLRGHQEIVGALAWSPDGRRLASGSWDRTVKVWDASTGYEREAGGSRAATADRPCR